MNIIDLVVIIPIIVGFVFGITKGLVKELASLAGIFIGIFGSKMFAPTISRLFVSWFNFSESLATPLAFMFLFAACLVLLILISQILDKLLSSLELGGVNKILGGVFGALKYAILLSVAFNIFDAVNSRIPLVNPETTEESFSYKPIIKLGPKLWDEFQTINIDSVIKNP